MTKQFQKVLGILSVFLLSLVLIGCTIDQESSTGDNAGSNDGELSIGFSISTLNNPFFVSMADGAEEKSEELGIIINVIDAGNDPAKQSTDIEDLINTGIDVLIVNPEDSASIGPAIQSAIDRNEGFLNALEGNVNIVASQTANFDRTEALTVTENLLQAHPNLRAIIAANDEMALGAIEAVNGAGSVAGEDVLITGFDANDDAINAVGAGTMFLTVEQRPDQMGAIAIEAAIDLFEGNDVDSEIPSDVTVLDAETIENR